MPAPKVIALYLPQFHPVPENDQWWGKGFTEWTNVGKAKKLFPGHNQPRVPADLGYYDLRVPQVREEQANLARGAGIAGFCYWHYWFEEGKELLDLPFKEVLASGKPDFPFCLGWANENWYSKLWSKDVRKDKLLIEQKYGEGDFIKHFYSVLPAFRDKRYLTQDDKPIFLIYKPLANPAVKVFMQVWNSLAAKEGLKGIYWVGQCTDDVERLDQYKSMGFDSINVYCMYSHAKKLNPLWRAAKKIVRLAFGLPAIFSYKGVVKCISGGTDADPKVSPTILAGWDHTPRSGRRGCVMTGYTPKAFKEHARQVLDSVRRRQGGSGLVFLKSWNEWAEGNYIEPDLKWGMAFLDALKDCLLSQ